MKGIISLFVFATLMTGCSQGILKSQENSEINEETQEDIVDKAYIEELQAYVEDLKAQDEELNEEFDNCMNMTDMKICGGKILALWQDGLAHVEEVLMENLSDEEYEEYLEDKEVWEEENQDEIESAESQHEGGSMQGLDEGFADIESTKNFVIEIVENLE